MGSPILRPRDILAVIELIYFVPVLVAALLVCRRHGFGKQLGWFSIVMLASFRISATTTWIAASYDTTVNGLVTASVVLQNFGLASILVSVQGILSRLNEYVPDNRRVPSKVFRLAHLLTSAGVGLALAGAIELGDSNSGNDNGAHNLQRSAIILFVVLYIILCLLDVQSFVFRSHIMDAERPLLKATSITLPLLAPRLLFAVLALYDVDTKIFSSLSQDNTAVIVSAIFVTLPEFMIAVVILRAGFKVPSFAGYKTQTNQDASKALEA